MKAWVVKAKNEFCATVVFAETRGKAKSIAMYTDACEDVAFCDIEVRREPQADKFYKEGKTEMDWYDDNDRIALVKDCNFTCEDIEEWICESCPAKEYCDNYIDYIDGKEGENGAKMDGREKDK